MSASLAPECNEVKERYDTCFLKWYSEKYLRGHGKEDAYECATQFENYAKCLKVGYSRHRLVNLIAVYISDSPTTKVALEQRGIDKLLAEAREDNKENDAKHLKRK
ncbi:hypothetical protein GGS24DRAFT_503849 [Hypoxylon argillaceum]|nr:hypothetical protein GGS24DRAFT_503849 [Hypoxylon argillaceum]KAI1146759.1 hypothetical protein F4825DRAFT_456167 [Nemania diffusa]